MRKLRPRIAPACDVAVTSIEVCFRAPGIRCRQDAPVTLKRSVAQPRDFAYAPGGTLHAFRGVSDTPAHMLIFDAPAHAAAFFKDVDREVTDLPRDLAKVAEIGARHQIRFVPPAK